jgi:hypothetical protein
MASRSRPSRRSKVLRLQNLRHLIYCPDDDVLQFFPLFLSSAEKRRKVIKRLLFRFSENKRETKRTSERGFKRKAS